MLERLLAGERLAWQLKLRVAEVVWLLLLRTGFSRAQLHGAISWVLACLVIGVFVCVRLPW